MCFFVPDLKDIKHKKITQALNTIGFMYKLMKKREKKKGERKSGKKVRNTGGGTQRILDGPPRSGSGTARGAGATSGKF